MTLWLYRNAFADADEGAAFEDTDENWLEGLSEPDIVEKKDKNNSLAVCGAEYPPGVKSRAKSEVIWSHALVLDVDVWAEHEPWTLDDLKDIFEGFRFIAWNTYSSTPDCPKWRVVLPLSEPMPPGKYRALWEVMNDLLEGTMASNTADVTRLGFIGTLGSQVGKDHYQYHINPGRRLDWTAFDLEDEELDLLGRALEPADLSKSPDWTSDAQALNDARRYFRRVGDDVQVGGRHETLLRASCRLWWDWAAPGEDFVREVLTMINNNFEDPKDEEEIEKELKAGYERVFGESRVEQPNFYGAEREPAVRATKEGVQTLAKRLKNRNNDRDRTVGRVLTHMASGRRAYADPNEVRPATFWAAGALAQEFFQEKPERLLDLMRPALVTQRADKTSPVPTDAEILQRVRWVQASKRKRVEEQQKSNLDKRKQHIKEAFGGDRDTGYTAREYRKFAANGLKNNQWILQGGKMGKDFYFFVDGDYKGPFGKDAAVNFAQIFLAPAHDKISLSKTDQKGEVKERPLDELVKEHGTYFMRVEKTFSGVETALRNGVLHKPLPPHRPVLEPRRSAFVDAWLDRLGQEQSEELKEWLAALTAFDRPAPALYLSTPTGSGKSLLAEGIARLWTTKGLPGFDGGRRFNPDRCPLIHIDGRLPARWRRDGEALIALHGWAKKKAHSISEFEEVIGFPRILLTKKNPDMFADQNMGDDQSDDRLLSRAVSVVHNTSLEASDFLDSKSPREIRELVSGDEIACHMLWLRDQIGVQELFHDQSDNRFLVQVSRAASRNGHRVLEWLYSYLLLNRFTAAAVVNFAGEIHVSPANLAAIWRNFSDEKMSGAAIQKALMEIGDKVEYLVQKRRALKYVKISDDLIKFWCESNGVAFSDVQEAKVELERKFKVQRAKEKKE